MENNNSVKERVMHLISEVIERPVEEKDLDTRFVEDWGIDSLLALEILAVMEKNLQIEVPEEELVNFVTVRQVVEVVERRLQEMAPAN